MGTGKKRAKTNPTAAAPEAAKTSSLSAGVSRIKRITPTFTRELADEESTDGMGVLRYGIGLGLEDPHPSWVLQQKSGNAQRLGEFYDEMLDKDADLAGFFEKRIRAVAAISSRIVPGDGSPKAKEAADLVQFAMGLIPNHVFNLQHQLGAIARGVAFEEIMWEQIQRGPHAGAWLPVDLIDRPMSRFLFRKGELYVRRAMAAEPLHAPPGKFLVLSYGTKDNRWGKALLDRLYWPWFFKKNAVKFYAIFLDKFGQPTAIGKYPHSSDEKTNKKVQQQLHEAIVAIQTEYGVTIPEKLAIEFLEAARSGNATYEQFIAIMTRAEAVAVLGEVDTSGAAKGPGSFAKSEVSNEVRFEGVELDARVISGHYRDNLYSPIVELNFGPDVAVPRLVIDTIEVEDREQRMKGIDMALSQKMPVSKRYFYQTTQVPQPEDGEETVEAPAPAMAPAPAAPATPEALPVKAPPQISLVKKTAQLADDPELLEELVATSEERSIELAKMAEQSAGAAVDYYGGWKRELLAAWDDGEVEGGTALRRLAGRINPLEHGRALHTAQVHAAGLALRHLSEDVGRDAIRLSLPPGWAGAKTPDSAMEFWAQLLQISKGAFEGLDDASRRFAFTVAGVNDMTLMTGIHNLLGEAIIGGWPRREFVSKLDELFEKHGVDSLSRWHAELVFANNVRQVAGLLKYQQLVLNRAAPRLTPYLMWINNFSRSGPRDEHALMNQFVAAVGHEIWKTWWIPAGHNCQCDVVPINLAKAKRLGYTGAEPTGPWPLFNGARVQPDPGFAGAPDLDGTSDELAARAEDLIDSARAEGNEDLLEALLQIFQQLIDRFVAGVGLAEFLTSGR